MISHDKFSLDLRRKKGRFARFKQSQEVHWLSISLGYNLPKAYWPLVHCSRLFSLPVPASFLFNNYSIDSAIIYSFFVTSKHVRKMIAVAIQCVSNLCIGEV